ncbi:MULTISPECIES: beta-N-acetylglucosaminidase domain-containing protein [Streptomyces]|uniref:Beta-N-acetylglucosaminidase domain-containing protein n=1 Tax=Streptomyces koelreuteriae TaxID=2838015 RepID=A0ABX8FX38_9ACTN|nr:MULTISPECIES: beta-N-acetylglucosaminidase domain-containing protein [Streptomyces]QWB25547.1 beta-N-acetylglucosaminidase domain-containing protein [Streptomyces koelreuteriae]UUA08592.1 beta-N-acetylglucosaminidase domain-containing protein [Streptomyces koelreuteriae]UUA16197.1 beta-N-acetylglucosaminidase domain-containing protein [Streptomyces sp. CRCS-T-1]
MGLRRGKRAVALAVAVVAGSLGAPPAAVAAPPAPGKAATPTPDMAGAGLSVWPRPQSLRGNGAPVEVTDEVALLTDPSADPYAVEALRALLRQAGARRVTDSAAPGALVVRAGTEPVRRNDRRALPSGGYELTVGRGAVSLTGTGEDGLFHAVQTLRQLLRPDGTIAAAVVRDWPGTAVRGITEGFYGTAWTHRQRMAQIGFMGRTKQNRYLYAPGDDLYRQARWREPYPAKQRAAFRELAERARANHVRLGWAVAPGQAMCFASDDDVRALTRKIDAMWALGFRAFQLQFQDVSYSEWHCEADADRFGSGPRAAAEAQSRVANAVARHLAERHPGAAGLSLMPTEYYEDGTTDYRRALASELDEGVEVAWTGVGVVPRTITGGELADAREALGHPLVTMDNYPVNDYDPGRIFLGPYQGREPAVATGSAALLANAMQQPEASRIPLFTAADYAWNPRSYSPGESWRAAIADLAGGDRRREQALSALAGNDASSVLNDEESAYLRPLTEAYWRDPAPGGDAARRLREAFTVLRELPRRLSDTALASEVAPWSEQLARYGRAGTAALDMLDAQRAGDRAAAWTAYRELGALRAGLESARAEVGTDVLDPFLRRAQKAYASWAGIDHEPPRNPGAPSDDRTLRFPRPRPLTAVTVLTDPGTEGTVEAHVPDQGWQPIGRLSGSGATEVRVRVRGGQGADGGDGSGDERGGSGAAEAQGQEADGRAGSGAGGARAQSQGADRWGGSGKARSSPDTGDARAQSRDPDGRAGSSEASADSGAGDARAQGQDADGRGDPGAGEAQGVDSPVDAVRVAGPAAARVRHLVPWFEDSPAASLELERDEVDAETGRGLRLTAGLGSLRPADARGRLTVEAPEGVRVRVPKGELTVERGTRAEVPVEVTVERGTPMRSYDIRLGFAGATRTLTVRAVPPTGGPDLARTGTARSSGDETPDFPASAANDGAPDTRWSSPVDDGAWWQVELPRPARIGQVVLRWQDAHPSAYRVQVSADGRRWRTAATVRDSRGGRESVRMDERDVRFLRVQGDKRATRFGYSLWSAEAYAITE